MKARSKTWAIWAFWALLTFLPLFAAAAMVLFRLGFNTRVWIATLAVAMVAFVKAQQAATRMRRLSNNLKIGGWLDRTKKVRDAARQNDGEGSQQPRRGTTRRLRRIGEEQNQFPRSRFWRGLDDSALVRHVGDLFHLLGMTVNPVANLERERECLLLDGDSVVEFIENGTIAVTSDVRDLAGFVSSKTSTRRGILVSTRSFKRSVLQYADNTPVILFDPMDLAKLGRYQRNE